MEKYLTLMASFVKRQYYPHLLLTLLFVAVSGGFVSFKGLEEQQAARVMEMYAAFAGILLFPPLFMPEQDREIWNLERSKALPGWKLYLLRFLPALSVCILLLSWKRAEATLTPVFFSEVHAVKFSFWEASDFLPRQSPTRW